MKTRRADCRMTSDQPAVADGESSRHWSRGTRHGFTLIELLVVIAVMAVLAGFTLSVLGGVKKRQYVNTARAELDQIATALDNYKAKYGTYPPGNQNNDSVYAPQNHRSQFSQLYYELAGVAISGSDFVALDGGSQIPTASVKTAFGVDGFINCSKGAGEDAISANNFLPGLKANRVNQFVTNSGVQTAMLVTSVGGPDQNYQPLGAAGINPFRYVYPGINNPASYDLWVQLVVSGKTNLVCNWSKQVQINSPLP